MRSHRSVVRLVTAIASALAVTLVLAGVTTTTSAAARPIPPGGSSAVLVITNQTGMPLTLSRFPDTSVGAGSSSDFRWIDAPPATLNMGQTTVVRAWTSNPATMGVEVTYSYTYRFDTTTTYRSSLGHIFGYTTLQDTGASAGESVYANIFRYGPAMGATFVLS
ncbi:hypothetical protein QSJ19_11800 [Gordonia sp. ABSL11-1]|uniref:hypothetical protein n=1 Tax=Gordonia sp. ABSL11-1 TaxID=3053924 RepID=UPI0025736B45|nr:hypothetical protein [Gordonia sp. ABSL11-1]MDL9946268.1 hypothetical protein [Gordonia sp. ABSL11-1]